jgi:quinol monooxygenase YgiN
MKKTTTFQVIGVMFLLAACTTNQPAPEAAVPEGATLDTLNTKMITAKVFLKPEKVADFIEAAKAMIDSSNAEPGCLSYQLYQNPYDPAQFIFVETWKDQEAIDIHFAMPYFIAFGPIIQDWLAQPTELKIIDVSAIQ